jgi:hypothetical protein
MSSPSSRSIDYLRDHGYIAQVVERMIPYTFHKLDLFHCIDIIAAKPGEGVVGVQATTTGNINARIKKAMAIPELKIWLMSGAQFWVHGWAKRGPAGKRKLWNLKAVQLTWVENEWWRTVCTHPKQGESHVERV